MGAGIFGAAVTRGHAAAIETFSAFILIAFIHEINIGRNIIFKKAIEVWQHEQNDLLLQYAVNGPATIKNTVMVHD